MTLSTECAVLTDVKNLSTFSVDVVALDCGRQQRGVSVNKKRLAGSNGKED